MNRSFGWSEFLFILAALRWTAALSAVAFLGGGALGLFIAVLRTSPTPVLRWAMRAYIGTFQGTPVLMQLFLAYYGITVATGIAVDPWPAVALALTLYSSAFLGEIWRGAVEAIPRGQWEASRALSLPRLRTLRLIILPQAFRIAIPATVGFLVQVIKSTAIASIIGFVEVTRAGQLMSNVTFEPLIVYPVVAGLYFALCWPLTLASEWLEARRRPA